MQEAHAFIAWFGALGAVDAAKAEGGRDVILSDLGGRRFAVGMADRIPLFCWHPDDQEALGSVPWTSAAIAYGLKGRDWFALSANDVRVKDSPRLEPVPLRLFVPVTAGRLAAWKEFSPEKAAVGAMEIDRGQPVRPSSGTRELPLKLLGGPDLPASLPRRAKAPEGPR